jgi:hypothetical protein
MRVDAYTKIVLTIIAGCLLWICVTGALTTPVSAQATVAPQEVILVGVREPVPVVSPPRTSLTVVYGAETAIPVKPSADWFVRPLPARLSNPEPLPMRLVGVEHLSTVKWDPVDVNVRPQAKTPFPGTPVPDARQPVSPPRGPR